MGEGDPSEFLGSHLGPHRPLFDRKLPDDTWTPDSPLEKAPFCYSFCYSPHAFLDTAKAPQGTKPYEAYTWNNGPG